MFEYSFVREAQTPVLGAKAAPHHTLVHRTKDTHLMARAKKIYVSLNAQELEQLNQLRGETAHATYVKNRYLHAIKANEANNTP